MTQKQSERVSFRSYFGGALPESPTIYVIGRKTTVLVVVCQRQEFLGGPWQGAEEGESGKEGKLFRTYYRVA